ncbi:MAG: hypothetical protein ACRYF5_09700 [Janthinobacterium lividum]
MPGNSSINDNNANIAAGKAMMGVWLSQTNTNNPINDYSVVMADLNLKLGSFLDVQKNYVKATSEKLNANNKLSRDILDFRAEAGAADRKLGQRNQDVVGTDASPGKDDAQVLARANDFIDRLHAVGIALDVRPPDSMGKEVKWTRIDELKAIPKTTSDDWGQKIQNNVDYINNTTQDQSVNLQSLIGFINKAVELSSGGIKRNADAQMAITRNMVKGG